MYGVENGTVDLVLSSFTHTNAIRTAALASKGRHFFLLDPLAMPDLVLERNIKQRGYGKACVCDRWVTDGADVNRAVHGDVIEGNRRLSSSVVKMR